MVEYQGQEEVPGAVVLTPVSFLGEIGHLLPQKLESHTLFFSLGNHSILLLFWSVSLSLSLSPLSPCPSTNNSSIRLAISQSTHGRGQEQRDEKAKNNGSFTSKPKRPVPRCDQTSLFPNRTKSESTGQNRSAQTQISRRGLFADRKEFIPQGIASRREQRTADRREDKGKETAEDVTVSHGWLAPCSVLFDFPTPPPPCVLPLLAAATCIYIYDRIWFTWQGFPNASFCILLWFGELWQRILLGKLYQLMMKNL